MIYVLNKEKQIDLYVENMPSGSSHSSHSSGVCSFFDSLPLLERDALEFEFYITVIDTAG